MCAQHLESGGTLLCRSITVETNRKYILSVAQLLGLFGDHPRDYREEYPTSTLMALEPTKVYTTLARWEKVPLRREPFTLEMIADMHENFASSGLGPDSMLTALVDWFEVSLFTGSRLSEWVQDTNHEKLDSYNKRREGRYKNLHPPRSRFDSVNHMRYTTPEASTTLSQW